MMKKFFFGIGFFATTLFAADCTISNAQKDNVDYPATEINFFADSYLDMSKMAQLEPTTKNLLNSDTAWAYRSNLDQTILVIVAEKYIKLTRLCSSYESCADTLYSIHYDEVYKDELARLQKAGAYKGSATQADSLVAHVLELCKVFYSKELGYGGCTFNNVNSKSDPSKDADVADMPLASVWNLDNYKSIVDTAVFCPELFFGTEAASTPSDTTVKDTTAKNPGDTTSKDSAATDTVATPVTGPANDTAKVDSAKADSAKADSAAADSAKDNTIAAKVRAIGATGFRKLSANRYAIYNVQPNAAFVAFDANGQIMQKGHLDGNTFVAKKTPVILKLEGEQILYLK